jgi:transcriptional regulator with XRE-family HTH domain
MTNVDWRNYMTLTDWKSVFANNLIDILRDRGMSQRQLAVDSGVSPAMISDYINGIRVPGLIAAINMAYALDMDVGDLVDFDERID